MKKISIPAIACLLTGFGFGYVLPKSFSSKTISNSETLLVEEADTAEVLGDSDTSQSTQEIETLQRKVFRLEEELAVAQTPVDEDEIFEKKRKEWLDSFLQREPKNVIFQGTNNLTKKLNLTPEQQIEADRLAEKQKIASRLMMLRSTGIFSEEELKSLYPEYVDFNYNKELELFLTDEQIAKKEEQNDKRRAQGSEMIAISMMQRYEFSDTDKFSSEESSSIKSAIKSVFEGAQQLEIPEAIEKLQVTASEKRILAKCYETLDQELFEKIYASMIEGKGE